MEKELKTPGFTKIKFSAACIATYESELLIPDDVVKNKTETLIYIREHLDEAPVLELNYVKELDDKNESVWSDDIHWDANNDEEE